jgi:IPT/TIG domain
MKPIVPSSFLFLCLSLGIFNSCSKKNNSTPSLVVGSINPTHGTGGDTVTITGSGFNASPSLDSVWVNGKLTSPITASPTQLQVTVPSLCGTGNVKVSANGTTGVGPVFTYDTTYLLSTFATGLNNPQYLAIDGSGNLFVTNFGNQTISKITPTASVTTFVSGIDQPTGITIDGADNLYVASNSPLNTCAILKISASAAVDTLADFTGYVYGLTIDNSGNIYAANSQAGAISMITGNGTVSTFAGGLGGISGITRSSNGNLYAVSQSNNAVYKITPDGTVSEVQNQLNVGGPVGIAVDNGNNLYFTLLGSNPLGQSNAITEISASGSISTLTTGLYNPCGLIRDANGDFYVVNSLFSDPNTLAATISKLTAR